MLSFFGFFSHQLDKLKKINYAINEWNKFVKNIIEKFNEFSENKVTLVESQN